MGLYDNLICEYPIDAPEGLSGWQTKDTEAQYLENYKIDKDGQLWHEYREYKAEMPSESDQEEKGPLAFSGCLKTTLREWRKELFRGDIRFYTSGPNETWWEYSALFDDGKLISIKRISPTQTREGDEG
jgi:hypothetical protein